MSSCSIKEGNQSSGNSLSVEPPGISALELKRSRRRASTERAGTS
jgi:hypothetical protein